ncbi:F-box-like domain-containing protein [Neochlamydia sp. EPS4]|uniref:F-box-like domain-containing protein n=1 Tax=Neochlamydia sp. EPS4 TaxID=1478175 RepID=UPI00210169C7|nr:F-box-like domain-containing protein [Neochlamydia sp. EPS4]
MPEELIVHIFSFLSPKELVNAQQVCKRWKRIGDEETLWKRHHQQHFKDEPLHISFYPRVVRSFRNSYLVYSRSESIRREVKLEDAALRAHPDYNGRDFSELLVLMN